MEESIVTVVFGQPVVSSLMVAKHFKKRHSHVLRDILTLIEKNPPEVEPFFIWGKYNDSTGRIQPMRYMNKDGFCLLVMSYTGTRVFDKKIYFLKAFRERENELIEKNKAELTNDILRDLLADAMKGTLTGDVIYNKLNQFKKD